MNLLITLIVGVVFGLVGGMLMTVLAIKAGYFATRDELDLFMTNMNQHNAEFASQLAREFVAVDDRVNMLDARVGYIEKTPIDISEVKKNWDEHKRWSLECWNEVMNTKDSYLTQFEVKETLKRFLSEISKLPNVDIPETKLNKTQGENVIEVWTSPMGPVTGGKDVQRDTASESLN